MHAWSASARACLESNAAGADVGAARNALLAEAELLEILPEEVAMLRRAIMADERRAQARPASPSSRDGKTTLSSGDGRDLVSLCPVVGVV